MDLILHLGAHRTGSTAFEQALSANARRLRRDGIVIWKPARLRRLPGFKQVPNLAAKANRRVEMAARLTEAGEAFWLAANATGADTLVLSEENLLGSIEPNLRHASLYPEARARLAAYAALFVQPPRRIGLGIRSYIPFWLSSYAYVLRRRPLPPLERLIPDLVRLGDPGHRGWVDVVADFRAVFPDSDLLVWPAEALRDGATLDAACTLIGRRTTGLNPGPAQVNAGPAAAVIPQIHALRQTSPDLTDDALDAALAALPPPPPYAPFSAEDRRRMDDAYARDLATIAQMPGVALYAPPLRQGSAA